MERERLVKVVRDRVPKYLPHSQVEYRTIEDTEQFIAELRKKLVEEAAEYLIDPSLHELSDVLAVVFALARHDLAATNDELWNAFDQKIDEMGAFNKRLGMYVTTTEAPR